MRTVLFVCTGNTCRSPMAEAIFNSMAKSYTLPYEAKSFGLYASGEETSENAKAVVFEELGIKIKERSTPPAKELILEADFIIPVSPSHGNALIGIFGESIREKIINFPSPIPDPFGMDKEAYREVFFLMKAGIEEIIEERLLPESSVTIEEYTPGRFGELCEIENASFSHPWSDKSITEAVKADNYKYFLAVNRNIAVGYIAMMKVLDEAQITNVAVLPEYRKMGIGGKLLRYLIDYAWATGCRYITLEVREKNLPAVKLYTDNGFTAVGKRKDYYKDPADNAILMTLERKNP